MSDTLELAKQCGMYQGTATPRGSDAPSFYAEAHQLQAFRDACVKEATEELQARIAMQDAAIKYAIDDLAIRAQLAEDDSLNIGQGCLDQMQAAISANSEEVAAWLEKQLAPLQKEIARLYLAGGELLSAYVNIGGMSYGDERHTAYCRAHKSFSRTIKDLEESWLSEYTDVVTDPLRREVAMLHDALDAAIPEDTVNQDEMGGCIFCGKALGKHGYGYATNDPKDHEEDCAWIHGKRVLQDTKAAAEAYEKEVAAKAVEDYIATRDAEYRAFVAEMKGETK